MVCLMVQVLLKMVFLDIFLEHLGLIRGKINDAIGNNDIDRTTATGKYSISPNRNSVLVKPPLAALLRALLIISGVISTPMTRPVSPTWRAAKKQSKPAPQPRSNTTSPGFNSAIASGLPQPSPRLAPAGTADNSSSEYPSFADTSLGVPQHPEEAEQQLPEFTSCSANCL
jgi:hypothetical protein